jgi:hypothetical protein
MRQRLSSGLRPQECEAKVFEALAGAVKRQHAKEVLHCAAKAGPGSLTGHHLLLATKDGRNGSLLKDVMEREGSWAEGGVPSHVRGPAPRERTLFDTLEDPLTELGQLLLEAFAGQALRVDEVYERHGREGLYTLANYKDALKRLEEAGRVTATPPADERRARTMADHVVVGFPRKEA